MDRVTRYPILSIPHTPRATGLALDGDTSHTFELVAVGPEASSWGQDQEAQLGTARTGAPCGVRASSSQLSLRPLYWEGDRDREVKGYHLDTGDAPSRRPWDLEQERWAVIHGQAVRRSGTVATRWGTPDHGALGSPGQPPSTPPGESVVDREQIDFLAARQQFLSLEQAGTGVPGKPPARAAAACAPPGVSQAPQASAGPHLANGYGGREAASGERGGHGVPAGPSLPPGHSPSPRPQEKPPEPPRETPIEREIRLAQEREADLRAQRGLGRAASHQELVEIPARPLLATQSLATALRRDRGRPSLCVQRDMVQESRREEDHRQQSLRAGRASTPDRVSEDSQPGLRRALSSDAILGVALHPEPPGRQVNRIPPDAYQPYLSPGAPRLEFSALRASGRPGSLPTKETRATGSPSHHSEVPGKALSMKQEHWKPPGGPLRASGGVVRWEYFRLCPLRFRVPDVPLQAEAPHIWGWEVPGGPALRLQKSQSSELLEKEVESVLRRERELAEERRSALFPEVFSPPPEPEEGEGGSPDSRSSSRASGITGSYSVSELPLFTPIRLHSELVWTTEAPEDSVPRQRKQDLWYAGLDPSDHVSAEDLEATRVARHQSPMAERWEAGLYTSEDRD
ncbi:mitotic interactor and substrate of PLK1 [Tupaia chinensis]|uniref:A-kinase anchor protein 2 C-terminal domain-containing protein n=1 Tax=Tupaia chinensis TaxID=246437 RepID=L8Y4K4_TUPCH|nr:mitotic interactor and substrate of PLK1 [Tupaia chinensis]ELV09316.1 hypothetical protein TREES_T100020162 [Tupaia chinensis]